MKAAAVLMLLLAGCPDAKVKSRSTTTNSRTLATASERSAFLCGYLVCPTMPSDAVFDIDFHDNSGFPPGPSDLDLHAVVKMTPDQTELWVRGCTQEQLEARPEWLRPLLTQRPEWAPKSAPDTYTCGFGQKRLVHVKEGLVMVQLELH